MGKMNVCLINDSFPPCIDGVANAVVNYGKILSSGDGEATVVTPAYPGASDGDFPFPVIRYASLDTTRQVGYRTGLPFSPKLIASLETKGFDLIHSHCPVTSTLLARALRERIGCPVVMTYHTKFDIDIANAIHGKLLQEEAKHLLVENISACDEVWTVSQGAGKNLRSLGYEGEITIMPNGVDLPVGKAGERLVRSVTGEYDLPEGVPIFLFVGRMMWYKGIRIILDAMQMLIAEGKDFRMVFVGGGEDREEIIGYAHRSDLSGKVFFIEPEHDRSRIRAWYTRADIFLFPSTFDTNGLVVREAAACSLPSVLVAGSCAAEGVTDGVNGFLIEENASSLAIKLQRLFETPETIKCVGERATQDLYISWEEAVSAARERYGTVLEKNKAGEYASHRDFADELFRITAPVVSRVGHNIEQQSRLLEKWRSECRKELQELLFSQHPDRFL